MRSRQFKKEVGPLFHAEEVFQVRRSNVYPKSGTLEHVTVQERGSIQKDSPNMIQGLTPYHILEKLTSQTKKERCEVCWKEGSLMTGQPLSQKIHNNVRRKEHMFIRAFQAHPGKNHKR